MDTAQSVVLSALEFDVLWEAEGLPPRHVAVDVPSPGATHTERAKLRGRAWDTLRARDLVRRGSVLPELSDRLHLLARPDLSIDVWVWTDREIKGLAACADTGDTATDGVDGADDAVLGVVDGSEVWLIPVRRDALAESAVSVAGELSGGVGRSVSVPQNVLRDADAEANAGPERLADGLASRGVPTGDARELAGMCTGIGLRGQFGAECRLRDRRVHRAERVIAFHDTDAGRYRYLRWQDEAGRAWGTVTPADNRQLANSVLELLDELPVGRGFLRSAHESGVAGLK